MSEGQNRIDMLINGGSSTGSSGSSAAGDGSQRPAAPGSTSGTDGSGNADAQVYVDGHQVGAENDGLNLDVSPDGSAAVRPDPAPTGPSGHGGSGHHGGSDGQGGSHGQGGSPQHGGSHHQGGAGGHGGHAGGQHGGASGHHGGAAGKAPDAQHVAGSGKNAASADIAEHGFGAHQPRVETTKNADGSLDVLIHKGPHNPHDIRVHVDPGKHVTIDVSPGKHGHVNLKVDKAGPNAGGHGAGSGKDGAQGPGGGAGKDGAQDPAKGGKGGADAAKGGAPDTPKTPGGGGGPSGGGPSGGGGGPSGGGGGYPTAPTQPVKRDGGQRNGDPDAIRKLGDDIDRQPGGTMDDAHQHTSGINVGYPAFGVLGFPLNMAHNSVRDSAAGYLKQGRGMLKNWQQTLHTNASNWQQGEDASTVPGA